MDLRCRIMLENKEKPPEVAVVISVFQEFDRIFREEAQKRSCVLPWSDV